MTYNLQDDAKQVAEKLSVENGDFGHAYFEDQAQDVLRLSSIVNQHEALLARIEEHKTTEKELKDSLQVISRTKLHCRDRLDAALTCVDVLQNTAKHALEDK